MHDAPEARATPSLAPVSGFAYRTLDAPPAPSQGAVRRVDLAADDLVPAGCDRSRCYAVALVRPPGADGMQPEAVRVIPYP
jgi:hypothetical protein